MRPSSNSGRRPRGRPNRKHGQGQPGRNQSLDSSGPEGRIRGNASQIYERYLALARDASAGGDRVAAEGFFQHAEHYYRVVNDSTDPEPLNPGARQRRGDESSGQDAGFSGNGRGQPQGGFQNASVEQGAGPSKAQSKGPSAVAAAPDDTPPADGAAAARREPAAKPAITGLEPQPDLAESIPAAIPMTGVPDGNGDEPAKPRRGRTPRKRLTTKRAAAPDGATDAPETAEADDGKAKSPDQAPAVQEEAEKA